MKLRQTKKTFSLFFLLVSSMALTFSPVSAHPAETFNTYHLVNPEYQAPLKTSATGQVVIRSDQELADFTKNVDKNFTGNTKPENYVVPGDKENPAVNLYVYRPQTSAQMKTTAKLPILYYSHGGGYIMRGSLYNAKAFQNMANRFNMIVVTPKYRLTTEAPFPGALMDAYHGLQYTYEHGTEWGGDVSKIITMGDSAGGGLTATLNLYNKDHGKVPVSGEILVYPMLDDRTGGKADIYEAPNTGEYVWTRESNVYAWQKMGDRNKVSAALKPYFAPVRNDSAELKGLPSTYLVVGDLDLFLNEDLTYANKLSQAGVPFEMHVMPGVYHAFYNLSPQAELSKVYWNEVTNAVNQMKNR